MSAVQTHVFVEHDDGPLQCDVYPAIGTSRGVVVYLHGGGFVAGDRTMDAARMRALAEHGLTVVVPDYRLAPDAVFPAQVDDVHAALAWVADHRDELGSDGRIGLLGRLGRSGAGRPGRTHGA